MSIFTLTWFWRPLPDPFVRRTFVISPIFGTLHSISLRGDCTSKLPFWFSALGCTKRSLSTEGWSSDANVEPRLNPLLSHRDSRHPDWCRDVRQCFDRWPFCMAISQVDRLFDRYRCALPDKQISTPDLLLAMKDAWLASQEPECLPRSLYRLGWFRALGRYPTLVIGVHTPTDRLHAWLELDGKVIGEDYDEMLCYRGGIRYFLAP